MSTASTQEPAHEPGEGRAQDRAQRRGDDGTHDDGTRDACTHDDGLAPDAGVTRPRGSVAGAVRGTFAQWPFLLVLAVLLAAVTYLTVTAGHWRRGSGVISVSMLLAGALRLVLPGRRAGLLAARARWFDVACYWVLGAVILGAAIQLH